MTDYWHLRNAYWLATLPAGEAEAVRRSSVTRVYGPGEPIFRPAAEPQHVYLLEGGLVRIFRTSSRGAQLTVGYVRPGEVFGEVSVISGGPRQSFAEARTRSKILEIPRDRFLSAVQSSKTALYEVTKKIGRRLRTCQSRVEDLVFHDAPSRLARLLLRLADEFGRKGDEGLAVELPLTQQELASLIGTTRQTVSSILRELIGRRVIRRRRGELIVANPSALRQLARLSPDH